MEKIFKILSVFALLILIIVFSVYARERRFREYHLSKRIKLPPDMEPPGTRHTISAGAGEAGSYQAKDEENQLAFMLERQERGVAGTVVNREDMMPESESFIVVTGDPVTNDDLAKHDNLTKQNDLTKHIIARIPLTEHADILIFDPGTRLLYCCSREGALTIIRQHDRSIYKVIQRLEIPAFCNRLALDPDKGKLYVYAEGSVYIYAND